MDEITLERRHMEARLRSARAWRGCPAVHHHGHLPTWLNRYADEICTKKAEFVSALLVTQHAPTKTVAVVPMCRRHFEESRKMYRGRALGFDTSSGWGDLDALTPSWPSCCSSSSFAVDEGDQ